VKIDPPRPLTRDEQAFLAGLIGHVADARWQRLDLSSMRVSGVFDCGCSSFDLAVPGEPPAPIYGGRVADLYATTLQGKVVGVILWGADSRLTHVELYSLRDSPPFDIPSPETIADVPPWLDPAV